MGTPATPALMTGTILGIAPRIDVPPSSPAPAVTPGSVPVDKLNAEHPWYTENKQDWAKLELLYHGGAAIIRRAGMFLIARPKELGEVYKSRINKFCYQNILGYGLDYYLSTLFETDPQVDMRRVGSNDIVNPEDRLAEFYRDFRKNCDRKNTTYVDFWREVLRQMLLFQASWVLVDLPKPSTPPANLADQQDQGLLDPYIVCYAPYSVLNWSEDEQGNLEWVVIRTVALKPEFLGVPQKVERWYYYDRVSFQIYQRITRGKEKESKLADLIDSGPHVLASQGKVPVLRVQVPVGLWLANRVFPQVLEHLNQDNSYGWALFIANLAMPVLIGNIETTPTLSEAGFLKLPPDCQIAWTEPPGASYERSEHRVASLREEIFRSMYLAPQGRSATDTPMIQSGYAKEQEMRPASHIQNRLGDILRAAMQEELNVVAQVREEEVEFDVRGFQFIEEPVTVEIAAASEFQQFMRTAGNPSPMAEKENTNKVIRARFRDMNPSTLDDMCAENEAAPTIGETQEAEAEAQREAYAKAFAGAGKPPKVGDGNGGNGGDGNGGGDGGNGNGSKKGDNGKGKGKQKK